MSGAISIYYTPDGKAWANYLKEKLCSEEYNITTNLKDFETASSVIATKVNVFVITPDFVKLTNWNLMNYFDSSSSLAVLTGVTCDDWSASVNSSKIDALNDWCYHELLGEDLDGSVRKLIVLIISVYENIELGAVEPEEETYINVPADIKLPGKVSKALPPKKHESIGSASDEVFERSESKESIKLEEDINEFNETETKVDKEEDELYKPLPPSRPVNTVRYVFRQGDYVYVLLEDTNNGLVQVKFHEDDSVATAACVSEKTTVYSFQHKRTERETFDVTLDGIEIGYGTIEKDTESDRPPSTVSEEFYDYPRPCRASVISTTSGSSSMSSRSSAAGNYDQPPPCGNKTVGSRYVNSQRFFSDSSEKSEVKFSLSSSSPLIRDSTYESPKFWTGSDRDTVSEASTVIQSNEVSPPGATSRLDQIQKLLEDVTDPVNVLCQCLKAENLKHLDEKMTSMLESTEVLKHLSFKTSLDALPDTCDTLCPTLMHFGAKFNLRIFCKFLLDNPITRNCAVKRNRNGECPHDIARREGHIDLAGMMENVALQLQSSKNGLHDSGISLSVSPPAQSPMSPPARDSLDLYMDMSAKSPPSELTTTSPAKSILKKSSQGSIQSDEEDYEIPISHKTGAMVKTKPEFTVALGPSVYIADTDDDNDKTPVPSVTNESLEQPFGPLIQHSAFSEGSLNQRESNGIENPFTMSVNRSSSEVFRTGRKDLKSIFGMEPPTSAPYEVPIKQPKKHGMLGKLIGKKDKSRTLSNPKFTSEEMAVIHGKPHAGQKTHVFRRDLILSDPGSSDTESHGHSPKDLEIFKREKRMSDKKDKKEKNKKKVELMITTAKKRASMRLHHAHRDPVESAPALPPRPPPKQKPLGAF